MNSEAGQQSSLYTDIENIRSEIGIMKHTLHSLEEQLHKQESSNIQEKLDNTLHSYTQLLQHELQTLRSYISTMGTSSIHASSSGVAEQLDETEQTIHTSLAKIQSMQEAITTQKDSIRTEFVPLYSELNGVKKSLEEFEVILHNIKKNIVAGNHEDKDSIENNSSYVVNELMSISNYLSQLNKYIDTIDHKMNLLFESEDIRLRKVQEGDVIEKASRPSLGTKDNFHIEEVAQEYKDAVYVDNKEPPALGEESIVRKGRESEYIEEIIDGLQQEVQLLSGTLQSLISSNADYKEQYTVMHDQIQHIYDEIHAIHTKIAHAEYGKQEHEYDLSDSSTAETSKISQPQFIGDTNLESEEDVDDTLHTNSVEINSLSVEEENRSDDDNVVSAYQLEENEERNNGQGRDLEVLKNSVSSLYTITTQIKQSLDEIQSSMVNMRNDLHVVASPLDSNPHSTISAQELQTWIQYIQGLPEEFTHVITVLGVEYNGMDKTINAPFETVYGKALLSTSGEVQYIANEGIQYQEGVIYTEQFTCTIKNEEELYLSLSFSLSISLVDAIVHVVMQPVLQYIYLHNNHGLSMDIQIRNPAIGDSLYSTSVREERYYYRVCTQNHCIIQDIGSIDESEEIVNQFYIRLNPKATHHRYVLVHVYGYIAGIQYNDSHIYTIEYKEGVTDYPVLSSQEISHFSPLSFYGGKNEGENKDTEVDIHAMHQEQSQHVTGSDEDILIQQKENPVYHEEEYSQESYNVGQEEKGRDVSVSGQEEDTAIFKDDASVEQHYDAGLVYEEHAPYQEEYYSLENDSQNIGFTEENEKDIDLEQNTVASSHVMPEDALQTTVFIKDSIIQYAKQHELRVDHCICNGSMYSVQEVWLSRYGIVCVYPDGTLYYALQPEIKAGLLYKALYDVFKCVVYDEEGRQIDIDIAFEIRSTQEGVLYSQVDVNTISVEDMPPLRTFMAQATLSNISQTDYLLMIETYTKPYIYGQDMHSVLVCVLSNMDEVEDFIKNVVVYIPTPESVNDERILTIKIEGYHNNEYVANMESFTVTPEDGKQYYYFTDFMQDNKREVEEHVKHEEDVSETMHNEPEHEVSQEPDDKYNDYVQYDNYEEKILYTSNVINQIFESRNLDKILDEIWESDEFQEQIQKIQEYIICQIEEKGIKYEDSYLSVIFDDTKFSKELDFWIKQQVIGETVADMIKLQQDVTTESFQRNITIESLKSAVENFKKALLKEIKRIMSESEIVN